MQQIYTAKYIFDGSNLLPETAVVVQKGLIKEIITLNNLKDKKLVKNYGDCIITPGFIDLQLNGCGGVLFNDNISYTTLEVMYQTCLGYGTTSFLPTLITCDFKDVLKALETIKTWFTLHNNKRGVIGLHLEGPFISTIKKGIHPEQFIIPPTKELLEQIVVYKKYFPIKMTIAPEVFTIKQIQFLINNNIIVSLGHSNASYSETQNAIKLGARSSTHMFNAMSGLSARNPGMIAAILNSDIHTGLIVDLLHVDKANIQLLNKNKPEQVYLVTDAVTSMGTDMKGFRFGGKSIHVKDGMCLDENGVLAGANLTMPKAIANCINICGLDIVKVLNMASQIPAQVMGYGNSLGKIQSGYKADLIAFNVKDQTCQYLANS
ncbi:MAG: nagA [Burkholderiales bacterium]|nr:nagA [Burkholderiales bacterium]